MTSREARFEAGVRVNEAGSEAGVIARTALRPRSTSHAPWLDDGEGGLIRLVATQGGADVGASPPADGDGTDARFFRDAPAPFVADATRPLHIEVRAGEAWTGRALCMRVLSPTPSK